MSNQSFNLRWQEAMNDLLEQTHIEDETLEMTEEQKTAWEADLAAGKGEVVDAIVAFQTYACSYIKYMQMFKKLEACYDNLVHPQKRLDLRLVLDAVMARVVELKHVLVYWNNTGGEHGRNPDVPQDQPFPWEYVHMDDILVDLKLPPETLEVPIPSYFKEERADAMSKRDKLIEGYMQLKLGVDQVPLESKIDEAFDIEFSLQEAIEIIQRNERGRQGRQRALLVKELREEEKQRKAYDTRDIDDMDPEIAATHLQRMYRGFQSRKSALEDRENELIFIGMRPKPVDNIDALKADLEDAKFKRKDEQVENRYEFDEALIKYHDVVRDEEGPIMKDDMMEERRTWFTNELAMGEKFPEDLERFYLAKNPPTNDGEGGEDDGGGKKGKKKRQR